MPTCLDALQTDEHVKMSLDDGAIKLSIVLELLACAEKENAESSKLNSANPFQQSAI